MDRYVPWQEFVDAIDGMVGDSFEEVVQVELGIEVVEFG